MPVMTAINPSNKITVIDPTIRLGSMEKLNSVKKKKVAAYARVSSEHDEQQQSYEAQVDFYTRFISNNEEWEFVGVYADEGITGTNTKNREGFKRMVADAKAGMIDIILTKSISRFARNTVDTLCTVRELKALGIEVRFEKENIHTLDPKCEVMLTIMSSLAQEESRSISENVQWGKRKSMMDGQVDMPYHSFLGYKKGADGRPEIVPEEAEIVKKIFDWYLSGLNMNTIAKKLEHEGIKSPRGMDKWSVSTIRSMLSNEKYKGDALLQKSITVDYLSKKRKKNEGEMTQYYIRDSHEAIIDRDVFDYTQYELKRREKIKNRIYSKSALSAKVVCGHCGEYYGHKTAHNDKFHYDLWGCNAKHKSRTKCGAPNIKQSDLYSDFILALTYAKEYAEQHTLDDAAERKVHKRLEYNRQLAEEAVERAVEELAQQVQYNAKNAQDQTLYQKERMLLNERLENRKEAVKQADEAIVLHTAQMIKKKLFLEAVKDVTIGTTFTDELFTKTVDHVVVKASERKTPKEGELDENCKAKPRSGWYSITFFFVNGFKVTIDGGEVICK